MFEVPKAPSNNPVLFFLSVIDEWPGPKSLRIHSPFWEPVSRPTIDNRPQLRGRLEDPAQFRFEVGKAPIDDPALFLLFVFRK
jgi:hypothetical protein